MENDKMNEYKKVRERWHELNRQGKYEELLNEMLSFLEDKQVIDEDTFFKLKNDSLRLEKFMAFFR